MALRDLRYVPVLKARDAEIKALLRAPSTLEVTPLFELQRAPAPSRDKKTGEVVRKKGTLTDASYFLDDIARLWQGPFYVDIGQVADAGKRPQWWVLLASLNVLAPVPARLIPVVKPTSTPSEIAAAAQAAAVAQRAAVRVHMPTARANPSALVGIPGMLAGGLGLPPADVDVILDWTDALEQHTLDGLVSDTLAVATALGRAHGRFITVGTPNSDAFVQVGDWHPIRREWWLWLRLAHSSFDVVFGDYALYPPPMPAPASPRYGHLRYSEGAHLHVHRRALPPTGGGLAAAFAACCQHLVNQPYCMPASFSKADQRIHDIASGHDKESVAGKWRQLASEHHFSVVGSQLATPPVAPPVGTL